MTITRCLCVLIALLLTCSQSSRKAAAALDAARIATIPSTSKAFLPRFAKRSSAS